MPNVDTSLHSRQPLVQIIVPVYDGLEDTRRCLESVLAARCQTAWRLIVINDCSPDPQMTAWLRVFALRDARVEVLENPANLGFVATVNRGMALSQEHDVLLLNSDTEVANDWLDRIQRAAYCAERVASVTPFSNNATICSYPRFCQANELPGGYDTASLDRLFAQQLAGQTVEVPTAVGFCMYIRRQCLQEVGLFDVRQFGLGYGEENDFCMRARQAGWTHLHALDTFVRHTGGISFGESRNARQTIAVQTMRRLHPQYEGEVKAYVQRDPARPARRQIDLARLAARRTQSGAVRYVLHLVPGNGGGVDRHVRDICSYRLQDCILHLAADQGVLEDVAAQCMVPIDRAQMNEPGFVRALGRPALLHAHSTLGPVRETIASLSRSLGVAYLLTLHDIEFAAASVDVGAQEREARLAFVRGAAARIVPSKFIAELLSSALGSDVACELTANGVDHDALDAGTPAQPTMAQTFQIAVVGALSQSKGLKFLDDVVAVLPPDIRVVVIGYVDGQLLPGWFREGRIWVHGVFEPWELESLARGYGCAMAFFPNRQPESYCYALSDVWCAGLPALGPTAGAIGERIAQTGAGWTFAPDDSAETVAAILLKCLREANEPLQRVRFAVDQLLSRQEMITALNQHYDAPGRDEGLPPNLSAMELLAATHLNSAFFRGEVKRLSGDLAFARSQVASANEALQKLGVDYEARGAWIEKIGNDLARAQQELVRVEAARSREHAECVRQVDKLEHDVADTLAEARRLQAQAQEAAPAHYVAKLERDIAETLAEAHRVQAAAQQEIGRLEAARVQEHGEYAQYAAKLEHEIADWSALAQQRGQRIANLERAYAFIPAFIRQRLLSRAERTAVGKTPE